MKRLMSKIVLLVLASSILLFVRPSAADMGPLYPWSWEPVSNIHDRDAINAQIQDGHPIQTYQVIDIHFTPIGIVDHFLTNNLDDTIPSDDTFSYVADDLALLQDLGNQQRDMNNNLALLGDLSKERRESIFQDLRIVFIQINEPTMVIGANQNGTYMYYL